MDAAGNKSNNEVTHLLCTLQQHLDANWIPVFFRVIVLVDDVGRKEPGRFKVFQVGVPWSG